MQPTIDLVCYSQFIPRGKPVVTGEIRGQIDRIWDTFWSGGISNPLEVTLKLPRSTPSILKLISAPSSPGQFGWYGAATTYCQIDPKERIVAIALAQHFPFNQHNFFAEFQTGYYQALK